MKNINKIFIISFFIISNLIKAQSDSDSQQQLVYTLIYSKDFSKAKKIIESNFINSTDPEKKIIGYSYLTEYYLQIKDEENAVKTLQILQQLENSQKSYESIGFIKFAEAQYYLKIGQNNLFIKSINECLNNFKKTTNNNFILTRIYYFLLSHKAKNLSEEIDGSLYFLSYNHALKSKNNILINAALNNLAYYYGIKYDKTADNKFLDSANIYYKKSYTYIEKIENNNARKRSEIVYFLNYASVLKELNKSYDEISTVLNKALDIANSSPQLIDYVVPVLNTLASLNDDYGYSDKVEPLYLRAYNLSKNNDAIMDLNKMDILMKLSAYYENYNQPGLALKYHKELNELIQKNAAEKFKDNSKSLELFYKTQEKNLIIKDLQKEKKFYTALVILFIVSGLLLYGFLMTRIKNHKQKLKLSEIGRENALLQIKLENEEKQNLIYEKEKLNNLALATKLNLEHKNEIINTIKTKVEQEKNPEITKTIKDAYLESNETNDIQWITENIHPAFFKKLKEIAVSKLSAKDLKYAAFIYMNYDNVQIASVLKISNDTVRKNKYRLKQKLNIDKNEDLREFLQNLT